MLFLVFGVVDDVGFDEYDEFLFVVVVGVVVE